MSNSSWRHIFSIGTPKRGFPEQEMKYKDFDAWYDEVESFAMRSERLASDVDELKAAFDAARIKAT